MWFHLSEGGEGQFSFPEKQQRKSEVSASSCEEEEGNGKKKRDCQSTRLYSHTCIPC